MSDNFLHSRHVRLVIPDNRVKRNPSLLAIQQQLVHVLEIAMKDLFEQARLYRVELVRPKEAIGRNTTSNLQSGAIYGYAGLVEGLVERMQAELGGVAKVIATGGNAELLTDVARCIERVDENLRLDGLRMLYEEAHPPSARR